MASEPTREDGRGRAAARRRSDRCRWHRERRAEPRPSRRGARPARQPFDRREAIERLRAARSPIGPSARTRWVGSAGGEPPARVDERQHVVPCGVALAGAVPTALLAVAERRLVAVVAVGDRQRRRREAREERCPIREARLGPRQRLIGSRQRPVGPLAVRVAAAIRGRHDPDLMTDAVGPRCRIGGAGGQGSDRGAAAIDR